MPIVKVNISKDTQKMFDEKLEAAIKKYTKKWSVDEFLVRAIILQESMGKPLAIRLENHLKKASWYSRWIPKKYRTEDYAYCSMGYMQVLYGVARSYGFKGTPHDLLTEDNSIRFGVRHLYQLSKRYRSTNDIISAYNQGSPRRFPKDHKLSGKYRNQNYVTSVLKNIEKVTRSIPVESQPSTPQESAVEVSQPEQRSWISELVLRIQQALSLFALVLYIW